MSVESQERAIILTSYRYLRASMAGLIVLLLVSVAHQTARQGWHTLASISAYYYTPTHAAFVAVLIAVGTAMIVIKGTSGPEDILLNIAGMLAMVVALVPTSRGKDYEAVLASCRAGENPVFTDAANPTRWDCPTVETLQAATEANVQNNMFALLSVGLLALAATVVFVRKQRNARGRPWRSFGFTLAIYLVGAGSYLFFQERFITSAHYPAAVVMFACIVGVAVINARRRKEREETEYVARRDGYTVVATLMGLVLVVGVPLIVLDKLEVVPTFDATVFWVETVLIVLFASFWIIQTRDVWWIGHALRGDAAGPSSA